MNSIPCRNSLFGETCDFKLSPHLQQVIHSYYQLAYLSSKKEQQTILEKFDASLIKLEPQLSLGLSQECDLNDESRIQEVWGFIMSLYAMRPKSDGYERQTPYDFENIITLIENITNNGKVYCGYDTHEKFNYRCLPVSIRDTPAGRHRPSRAVCTTNCTASSNSSSGVPTTNSGTSSGVSVPQVTTAQNTSVATSRTGKGFCGRVDYPSVKKIDSMFQEIAALQVLPPIELTGRPSGCSETVETDIVKLHEARRTLIIGDSKALIQYYDKLFDLMEQIRPTEGQKRPAPMPLCAAGQGMACVKGNCKCGLGYEWLPAQSKCMASFGSVCQRCFPRSAQYPCDPPHECMPQSVCSVPFVVLEIDYPADHLREHLTKYCHYIGPPPPEYKFPNSGLRLTLNKFLNIFLCLVIIYFVRVFIRLIF